jgi:hypothetical protein
MPHVTLRVFFIFLCDLTLVFWQDSLLQYHSHSVSQAKILPSYRNKHLILMQYQQLFFLLL